TLTGLTHTFPDDLDFLLVGTDGRAFEFWSDAGGGNHITNGNFTITNSAASGLPDQTAITSGNYRPADYDPTETSSNWGLAPSVIINHPGTATFASTFSGSYVAGLWGLYVTDDAPGDVGSLAGGWGLELTYTIVVKPDAFNEDQTSDIRWQNSDGTPAIWLMDGTTATSIGLVGPAPGPSWHIKDNGDFDSDGRSDILFQNNDGTPAIWLMNGLTATSIGRLVSPRPRWQMRATGDVNFDAKADIVWQNNDGTPAIWLMDGLNVVSMGALVSPGLSWQIRATGDFNNDGKSDIVWQNSDGTPAIWLMDS